MKKSLLSTVELLAIAMVLAIGTMTTITTTTTQTFATAGMGNCKDDPDEECTPQRDRVGNDDPNDEDVDRDGPGGEDGDPNDNDEGEANCWGKVTSGLAHNNDGKPGIGEHSSDPVPNDGDNETPREGVGNQREGHPSDHADTVGGLANPDPDCVD